MKYRMTKDNQEFESFRIKSELMDELRTYLYDQANKKGETKFHGILRAGIEEILTNYLKKQKKKEEREQGTIKEVSGTDERQENNSSKVQAMRSETTTIPS